jgi:hypothetical protein
MMDFINKVKAFLDGKKTYIIAIIGGILGLLTACGIVIPEYVYVILGALGLGTLRAAVK